MLENALKPSSYKGPVCEFLQRSMNESNEESLDKILKAIIQNGESAKVGKLLEEGGIGNLAEEWKSLLSKENYHLDMVDCSELIDEIFAVKDPEELDNLRIASKYACFIMENLNKKFENIIDDDKKVSHSTIANDIRALTDKPAFQNKFREKYKISKEADFTNLEITSFPIIQSGGNYDLKPLCHNDDKHLSSDVIICKVNTRFKDYNSNLIRTFMIDADKSQQNNYKILYEAFNFLVSSIVEGVKISSIYEKVVDFIISKDPSLEASLPENFGFGIGLENSNSSLIINKSNEKKFQQGMSFNIIMSLRDLKNEKGKLYTLQIADTVGLKSSNVRENYTFEVSKILSDIYYNMEDEEEEDKKINEEIGRKMTVEEGRRTRRAALSNDEKQKEVQRRKDHQMELLERKNADFKSRTLGGADQNEEVQISKKSLNNIKSYSSRKDFPSDVQPGKIYVDSRNDTVILPIFKMMVPFHITLIKNVSKSEENSFAFLRINFMTPISGLSNISTEGVQMNQPAYIKDLTYKSKDMRNITELFKKIKDLIKKVKVKEQEEKEKSDLVAQENLIQMKGRRIFLNDVIIRPNITSKKTSGTLEAHQNGFRFLSSKGEKIDIIYKNIKHAFFQPCENELIVLVHFHLKNPIIVGKKKTMDVQFYREAGSQADDLDQRRRGNDYEEYEIELKERQIREKINDEFLRFTKQVEELNIEFDVPYRELAFQGVPYKSNVVLLPTAFCLVSLIELPFFVITLDEVELVYFERVSHSIKNFDMAFVFKDLNRQVHR
jgi:nucleosome binding factor SPN SPT16 subunit